MNKQWFIVYCKSREESRALENLENQGITAFFPQIRKMKVTTRKKFLSEEALFPSYLFIHIDHEDINFSRIRSTRGINDFIRFGNKVATVSDKLICQLKKLCYVINDKDPEQNALFTLGDKVEIITGSFKGLTAIFECEDGLERSVLLLKILNQEKPLSFNNSELKKL